MVTVLAYAPAIRGPFIFDGLDAIPSNRIRTLAPATVLRPPVNTPVRGRPITNLTLAINHWSNAVLGVDERPDPLEPNKTLGYHVLNLLLHLCCARCRSGSSDERSPSQPWGRSGGVAARQSSPSRSRSGWCIRSRSKPSITIQRTEILVSLFYCLTLYAAIRAGDAMRVIGAVLTDRNRPADAISYLERAVAGEPSSGPGPEASGRLFAGRAMFIVGRAADADSCLTVAAKAEPRDLEILTLLGDGRASLGRAADALAPYRRALQTESSFGPARERLRRGSARR